MNEPPIRSAHSRVSSKKSANTQAFQWMQSLIARGGPRPEEYAGVGSWIDSIAQMLADGRLTRNEVDGWWQSLGHGYLDGPIQGVAFSQRRGYAGDFEVMDRIHRRAITDGPWSRWDEYFHAQTAPRAVRNRRTYFADLVRARWQRRNAPLRVLNLGCGPCHDVRDVLTDLPAAPIHVTNVDQDSEALAFAREICSGHEARVKFVQSNVLRMRRGEQYDLVWSAGVMDYLDEPLADRFLRRCRQLASPNGEIVVGNFTEPNPSRNYMEVVGRWSLIHRSFAELIELGRRTAGSPATVQVGVEPCGLNLFLHVRCGANVDEKAR